MVSEGVRSGSLFTWGLSAGMDGALAGWSTGSALPAVRRVEVIKNGPSLGDPLFFARHKQIFWISSSSLQFTVYIDMFNNRTTRNRLMYGWGWLTAPLLGDLDL